MADGVRDPHAMTLSTVDPAGDPDARVLLLEGLDASGWQFAGHGFSPKGGRLACHPRAALTFYWAEHGRQVGIRGAVTPGSAEDNAADFLARTPVARAESLLARQSQYLTDCTTQSRSISRRRTRPPARRSPPWRPGGTGCWRGSPPPSPPAPNAPPPAPSSPGAPAPAA
ncbi:pyridoxamine 5'-phosphate oxidase family protein [Streptomyces xanthophaeus]|uniref:pyridoxamine 5'-phosphate oxidase family protein n=1 Tax=Streptomyces xanthophaeus TaxID=67385 RepID=UPI00068E6B76|nr:pyridoxamine 5'-phosphate oxidase family protein [Streptomyces xanthophaeus]